MSSAITQSDLSDAVEALARDANKPSLHALSYALRHPETWPEGFVWDYGNCTKCAMGLAHQLWPSVPTTTRVTASSAMARSFAMPLREASMIFLGGIPLGPGRAEHASWVPTYIRSQGHLWWKRHFRSVDNAAITPEMVADQIDKYLARPA
jgi:hypothetical protein